MLEHEVHHEVHWEAATAAQASGDAPVSLTCRGRCRAGPWTVSPVCRSPALVVSPTNRSRVSSMNPTFTHVDEADLGNPLGINSDTRGLTRKAGRTERPAQDHCASPARLRGRTRTLLQGGGRWFETTSAHRTAARRIRKDSILRILRGPPAKIDELINQVTALSS
jgi:hypothetical protein